MLTKINKVNYISKETKVSAKNLNDIQDSVLKAQSDIEVLGEQYNTKASKDEVAVERKRIDSFTSLAQGSTTGDAELIDARVGIDGIAYLNLGTGIRTQLNKINNITNELGYNLTYVNSCEILNATENTMYSSPVDSSLTTYVKNENGQYKRGFTFNIKPPTNPAYIVNGTYRKYPFTTKDIFKFDKNSENIFVMLRFYNSSGVKVAEVDTANPLYKNGVYTDDENVTTIEIVQALFNIAKINIGETHYFGNLRIENRYKNTIKDEVNTLKNEVNTLKNSEKKTVIMFNFDETSLDRRYELMLANNFNATWQYTVNSDKNMLKTLVKKGFDLSLYVSGSTANMTDDASIVLWKNAIKSGVDYLESIGVYYPIMYSCAGHSSGYALNEALKSFEFKYQRANTYTNKDGSITYTPQPSKESDLIQFVYPLANHKEFTDVKSKIDYAIANNWNCLMLMCHSFVSDGLTEEYFINICNYVKSLENEGKIKVLNAREYFEYYHQEEAKKLDRRRIMSGIVNSY